MIFLNTGHLARSHFKTLGLILALVTAAGCGGYDASIRLRLELDPSLQINSGGGYSLSLHDANGEPFTGLQTTFLPYKDGKQSAGVLVRAFAQGHSPFPNGESSAPAILRVELRQRPEGPAIALGTARVTLKRNHPVPLTVKVLADPRPLDDSFRVHYASDWSALESGDLQAKTGSLLIERSPTRPESMDLHLWSCAESCATDPSPRWIGLAPPPGEQVLLLIDSQGDLIARDHELLVSAESQALGAGSLSHALGWQVATGKLSAARRQQMDALLRERSDNGGGTTVHSPADAPSLLQALKIADTHSGFASGSDGSDDVYVRTHTAHAYWLITSGAAASQSFGGTFKPLPSDDSALGLLGDGTRQGRLARLRGELTAAAEAAGDPAITALALGLLPTFQSLQDKLCTAWANAIFVLAGSCSTNPPPECSAAVYTDLCTPSGAGGSPAASLLAGSGALEAAISTALDQLMETDADGVPRELLIDRLEKMTAFELTAASAP